MTQSLKIISSETIADRFRTRTPRFMEPYGIYALIAKGAHKRGVDRSRSIDCFAKHGHPEATEAIAGAVELGTYFYCNISIELDWASEIKRLISSAGDKGLPQTNETSSAADTSSILSDTVAGTRCVGISGRVSSSTACQA